MAPHTALCSTGLSVVYEEWQCQLDIHLRMEAQMTGDEAQEVAPLGMASWAWAVIQFHKNVLDWEAAPGSLDKLPGELEEVGDYQVYD